MLMDPKKLRLTILVGWALEQIFKLSMKAAFVKLPYTKKCLTEGLRKAANTTQAPTISCIPLLEKLISSTWTRKGIRQAMALIVGSFRV
jgi:hypothetical protein